MVLPRPATFIFVDFRGSARYPRTSKGAAIRREGLYDGGGNDPNSSS